MSRGKASVGAQGALTGRVSLWCVPAARSRVVAVLVRLTPEGGGEAKRARAWSGVMAWTPGKAPVQGAWSTLRLVRHRCRVDAEGEYLMYVAKDRGGPWDASGPALFRRSLGGGVAVSRLPWLSALTDVAAGCAFGGGASRHALSPEEQEVLWGKFGPRGEGWWFVEQQAGWEVAGEQVRAEVEAAGMVVGAKDLVAVRRVDDEEATLVAVVAQGKANTVPRWPPARYGLMDGAGVLPLPGVDWAQLEASGALLTAGADARLRVYRRRKAGDGQAGGATENQGPLAGWRVKQEVDLSGLEVTPRASPIEARRGVKTGPAARGGAGRAGSGRKPTGGQRGGGGRSGDD